MTIEHQHNGSILITDIVNGEYVKQVYYFYELDEAIAAFEAYIAELFE
jgi:hypothetical protein